MAIRNVFGAQSIRQKLLLGTLFLAIIPVAVTSIIVGRESLNSGRAALEAQAREALIAQRASKAAQITDYFEALSNQVQVLAASPDVVDAMRELPAAYDNSVISIADLPAERARLAKYYTGDFMAEFQKRNTGKTLNMAEHRGRAARPRDEPAVPVHRRQPESARREEQPRSRQRRLALQRTARRAAPVSCARRCASSACTTSSWWSRATAPSSTPCSRSSTSPPRW